MLCVYTDSSKKSYTWKYTEKGYEHLLHKCLMITIYDIHRVLFEVLKFLWLEKRRYITRIQRILGHDTSAGSYRIGNEIL
jgi:hypothetical protein